ncbi:MAG: lipoprotein-releasing ABC transporter permease subunit [Acidobacteriota bacterium]|nr:MAG: lipoprotein-releasing ABC transporter permease subunit [Acidobacteriota bacterium]
MSFELRIALRYLIAQRRQLFISVISTISTLGVIVGVMILLIALAILTGFQGELRSRILGAASHLSIYKGGGEPFDDYRAVIAKLGGIDGIEGAAPVLYGKALISSATGSGLVTLKGIEPMQEATVTEFGQKMVVGGLMRLTRLVEPEDDGSDPEKALPGIVVGEELAMTLGVFIGDVVKVTTPEGHLTPFGMIPRTRSFRVVGIFRLGLYNFDNSWALLHLPEAQRLLGVGDEAMYVETKVRDLFGVEEIEIEAMKALGSEYGSMNWKETNASLFSAFWLEKMVTTIFISFIVGVAALNIVASQIMIVMNKTRDIAILRSMGASAKSIMRIFMLQGSIIGVVGTLIGAALGVTVSWVLDHYRLVTIPEDVYQVAWVPFKLLPTDFLLVVLAAPLICFLATLYPARRAAQLVITEALRFE